MYIQLFQCTCILVPSVPYLLVSTSVQKPTKSSMSNSGKTQSRQITETENNNISYNSLRKTKPFFSYPGASLLLDFGPLVFEDSEKNKNQALNRKKQNIGLNPRQWTLEGIVNARIGKYRHHWLKGTLAWDFRLPFFLSSKACFCTPDSYPRLFWNTNSNSPRYLNLNVIPHIIWIREYQKLFLFGYRSIVHPQDIFWSIVPLKTVKKKVPFWKFEFFGCSHRIYGMTFYVCW